MMNNYKYSLPKELVAHSPANPRDSAKLLIYSTKTDEVLFDTVAHLARYIPANSLLVLNDVHIVPTILECTKITGGIIRILFLFNEVNKDEPIKGMPDKDLVIDETLYVNHRPCIRVISQLGEEYTFKLLVSTTEFEGYCKSHANVVLPQSLETKLSPEEKKKINKTISSTKPISTTSPNASLHFTYKVVQSLIEKGVQKAFVTLHVGRSAYSPITKEMIETKKLYKEPFYISEDSAQIIAEAKKQGKTIVASSTTSTRLLESYADFVLSGKEHSGETTLMITPPYQFKVVDALVTNFHISNTPLLTLVDAFLQFKKAKKSWRDLYKIAIKEKFRFYSFGDAMLII